MYNSSVYYIVTPSLIVYRNFNNLSKKEVILETGAD